MLVNLNIENVDVAFIKKELKDHPKPIPVTDVVFEMALSKTNAERKTRVKVYSPDCEYKAGDLIFKEYSGNIPTGAKKFIEINGGVVLKVVDTRNRHGLEEIKLSYEGTSGFKKYTDYLDRQKIELLLPHKQAKPPQKPELLAEEEDPRTLLDPMVKRELSQLSKKVITALNKDEEIVLVAGKVLLREYLKPIESDVFERIKIFLADSKASEATEFFVENFLKIKPSAADFEAYCFALSFRMLNEYKIDFHQTQSEGWGKWNLISVIYRLKRDSIISSPNPLLLNVRLAQKKNLSFSRKKLDESIFSEGTKRFYLTQREVVAGALRVRPGQFEFGDSIEIEATDTDTKKIHHLFYYSDASLLLGLKDVYEAYFGIQGMCVQMEQVLPNQVNFNIRTTKKGMVVNRIVYDKEQASFRVGEEQMGTPVFVNKAIFLEAEVINAVADNRDTYKRIETFNQLFHKIFLDFGVKDRNYEIHLLRLYHILDLIYPTEWRMVLDIVLSNPEFIPSDKVSGVYYLDSEAVMAIEGEEQQRRMELVEERRRDRDEQVRIKQVEEEKEQDGIRLIREERRIKREDEMRQKEKIHQEANEVVQEPSKPLHEPRKPDLIVPPVVVAPELLIANEEKKATTKRQKKQRPVEEKGNKVGGRRHVEEKVEDDIDLDEIKRQIELEELKTKAIERAKEVVSKPAPNEKAVAYQDDGGSFAGLFASKLDEIAKDKKKGKK